MSDEYIPTPLRRKVQAAYAEGYAKGLRARQGLPPVNSDLVYPVRLRDGIVRFHGIPNDLTEEEAERLCRVIRALAVGTVPA